MWQQLLTPKGFGFIKGYSRPFTNFWDSCIVAPMDPNEYARSRSVDPKRVRSFLRSEFPRSPVDKNSKWYMTSEMIAAADHRFRLEGRPGRRDPGSITRSSNCETIFNLERPDDPPGALNSDDVVAALVADPVQSVAQVRPPASPGFYAWWCRAERLGDSLPPIPLETRSNVNPSWSLLYVGISPRSAASSGVLSTRLGDHVDGNIGDSTFRQSVASLLIKHLELQPVRGSDRSRLLNEIPLSQWIAEACGLTFTKCLEPWTLEGAVINTLKPPLNLAVGPHPFAAVVSEARSALRRSCGT